jgi:hypothetical protein
MKKEIEREGTGDRVTGNGREDKREQEGGCEGE